MTVFKVSLAVVVASAFPIMAHADESGASHPVTVSGTAALTSDYRFRGVSQSDGGMAVQAGVQARHQSGVYAGAWASNLAGWGTFGGANMELDLIAGYTAALGDSTSLDAGLTWYMYPGGASDTDFAEPYLKLATTRGAMTLTAGVAYAPRQYALANVSNAPDSRGQKEDNLYLWGDGSLAIGGTPVVAKGHLGHSNGNPGLGPNGTSVAPTGAYWDWSLGLDANWRNVTFNVSYVDTDITRAESMRLQPNFSTGQDGRGSIAGATVVTSATLAF